MAALGNAKIERFCQEYETDRNGTAAAIRAGYSEKNAASQASRLLKREDVQARVRELTAERAQRLGLTADRVLVELWEVYARCMQLIPATEWDSEAHEYVETGEFKFDARGAEKALELIGRHLGMFTQKVEVGGNAGDLARLGEIMRELGMRK